MRLLHKSLGRVVKALKPPGKHCGSTFLPGSPLGLLHLGKAIVSYPASKVHTMTTDVELRAYRFALDVTPAQLTMLRQHAGAARWAYNHALAAKFAALDERKAVIAGLVEQGVDPKAAAAQAPKIPTKPTIQKALNATVVSGTRCKYGARA